MLEHLLYFSPLLILVFGAVLFMLLPQVNEEHTAYSKPHELFCLSVSFLTLYFIIKIPYLI